MNGSSVFLASMVDVSIECAKCAKLCRKHCMLGGTLYRWNAKFHGMRVSEARRLKVLENESAKLKKLLAEQIRSMMHNGVSIMDAELVVSVVASTELSLAATQA